MKKAPAARAGAWGRMASAALSHHARGGDHGFDVPVPMPGWAGLREPGADAASAGMAGLRAGVAGAPPPKAAPLVAGLARPVSLWARGAGDFCIAPDAAVPGGMAGVSWAAAGRFQASAVVTSTAAGTVRKMRLDMG